MIVRLYETGNLDLETVGDMLWRADRQANFHPESRWLDSNRYSTEKEGNRSYREFTVRWIGREAVIMWLISNQILYEVISYGIIPQEEEAIQQSYEQDTPPQLN